MLKYPSNLIQIKQLIESGVIPKRCTDATNIALMAYSGLVHTQLMPDLCMLLKKIFHLTECGFFWSDSDGELTDAWCTAPQFLNYATLMSCANYQAAEVRTWPTFRENVGMGPMCGYLLPFQNARFYASSHFKDVYANIGVRHLLDVVVHDGKRPYGAFLMMRSELAGRFTPDERGFLEKLIPVFCAALIGENEYVPVIEQGYAGVAVMQMNQSIALMDKVAQRLCWELAFDYPFAFANSQASSLQAHLQEIVRPYWPDIIAGEVVSLSFENRWGIFNVECQSQLSDKCVLVHLRKKQALSSLLIKKVHALNLPPVRQMVALLLAFNYGRKEIAIALGITEETVSSHIKTLYAEAKIKSGHDLLLKLMG